MSVLDAEESARSLGRAQAQIWAGQRLHPQSPLANMAIVVSLHGRLDAERFVAAFDRVVHSSDTLSSVVVDSDSGPRLVPAPELFPTAVIDLDRGAVESWCSERIADPLDPTVCVYDSVLFRHDEDTWTWWLDIHHVATDAASTAVVVDAIWREYSGDDCDLRPFGEYLDETASRSRDPAWIAERERWSAQARPQRALALFGPIGRRTPNADRLAVPLESALSDELIEAIGGRFRTLSPELSLLVLAATATAVAVHRLDGRTEMSIGVPVHHRSGPTKRIIGPVIELYPLRIELSGDETLTELHSRVTRAVFDLLKRARPGTAPEQDFEVVLNVIGTRVEAFDDFSPSTTWVPSGAVDPSHLVRFQIHDFDGDKLDFHLDVSHAVGGPAIRRSLAAVIAEVIERLVRHPDSTVGGFALTGGDRAGTVGDLSRPALAGPRVLAAGTPVDAAIHDVLGRDPHRPVVADDGAWTTAGELQDEIGRVGRWLARAGVGRGDRVGLRVSRGVPALVLIQAVLRRGACFVMLDPDDPPSRHEAIRTDADLVLILDGMPPEEPVEARDESDWVEHGPDDLAYILYTSGSTGVPKGVPISHRGLAEYLEFAHSTYVGDGPAPTAALHSRLVFDLTITALFLPLLSGGRIVVIKPDGLAGMKDVADDDRIDFLKATPSQLELFARLASPGRPLRSVIVGGEAFRRPLAERVRSLAGPDTRIWNEYGPTEAVVGSMIHEYDPTVDQSADVPIGAACAGSHAHLLDPYGHPVPDGAWGELWVGRPGQAEGYLGRPDLTAERFRPLPGRTGPTLYRTGDRARIIRPGVAVYGGRLDDQLKVGGIRVEPGEIEAALVTHPEVTSAHIGMWSPGQGQAERRLCIRCGLGSEVPGVTFDTDGICSTCRAFDEVAPQAERWFRSETDLDAQQHRARARRQGDYDCLHLLSGGKDSTYALYQLVERGWAVHALTLDNGYLSPEARANIVRSIADLGISHEFVATDAMAEIFRDSLERYSNVCNGCYKTIYTLAVSRAHEMRIPVIVTGLSRGQFFETRLVPHQFDADRFDPDHIDEAVLAARKVYHRTDDAVTRLLDTTLFETDDIFEEIEFVDFYRYVDVPLADVYRFLDERAPWVRPSDTGRSTNCLINVAGIHVHRHEQGFHNYALPYSWDVKLGHKTRLEALEELDDEADEDEVARLLAEIGHEPRRREVLCAWYQADRELDADELRRHLRGLVSDHALPGAFVHVEALPLARSAKVDLSALPAPTRFHRVGGEYAPPNSPLEVALCELWGEVLGLERVGVDHDFFDVGGDSLAALDMVTRLSSLLSLRLPEAIAFEARTVRELARLVDTEVTAAADDGVAVALPLARSASGPSLGGANRARPVPAAADPDRLSPGQEALLFEARRDPRSPRFGVTRMYRLPTSVDPERLRSALLAVIARHDPLRRTFSLPRRVLTPSDALAWRSVTHGSVTDLAAAQAREPFDLDDGPLVRATYVHGEPAALVLSLHHLWCDATSFRALWRDLDAAYQGRELPNLAFDHADLTAWHSEQVSPADLAFWDSAVPADVGSPDLGLERPTPAEPDGYLQRFVAFDAAADRFPAFLAAVDLALAAYDDEPIVVSVPVSLRDRPHADDLIGYLLNPVPVLLPRPEGQPMAQLVGSVRSVLAAALAHRRVPAREIAARRRRAGSMAPLGQVMAVHDPDHRPTVDGIELSGETIFHGRAVTDLTFFLSDGALVDGTASAMIGIEWSGQAYSAAAAVQLLDDVVTALDLVLSSPEVEARPLTAHPADDLVGAPLAAVEGVMDRIRRHTSPAAVAVRQDGRELTQAGLLSTADRVATALTDAGVGHGDRVALVVGRRIEQVAAILGVLRIGAAYVPVDPDHPVDRVQTLLDASGATVVLTDGSVAVSDDPRWIVMDLDDAIAYAANPPNGSATLDDPAYVIHTSGSTGVPRGVAVSHRNLAASTIARDQVYAHRPGRFLWTPSIAFDSSVAGLFWALASGGTLVLPAAGRATDADHLLGVIENAGVTHLLMVPSLWGAMLARRRHDLSSLLCVMVAGEACPRSLVNLHHEVVPEAELWNEYGPTEATVWASAHRTEAGSGPVPIGRPIPGVQVRVAGRTTTPRPRGGTGELLIAGPTVTAGYPADPDATEARFVVDDHGTRFYRTGDRVRFRSNGEVEFLGRIDHQLSVGGVRVEPEEIEQALRELDGVVEAVVRLERRGPADPFAALEALPHDEVATLLEHAARAPRPVETIRGALAEREGLRSWLVAHVEGPEVDPDDLRGRIAQCVPDALVPQRVVVHDRLPRTPNGKVDRGAVPMVVVSTPSKERRDTNAGSLVERIVALWSEQLELSDITDDTDFFATGADSLDAVAAVERMETELGHDVPISALVVGRTPRGLAQLLAPGQQRGQWELRFVLRLGGGHRPPLFVMSGGGDGGLLHLLPLVDLQDDDLRVVGLRYPSLDTDAPVIDTIDGLADTFLPEILHEQPDGPIRLLGTSTGGLVAYELADRLAAAGRQVDLLALGDTFFPGENPRRKPGSKAPWRQAIDARIARYAPYVSARDPRGIVRDVGSRLRRRVRRVTAAPAEVPLADKLEAIVTVLGRAERSYRPPRSRLPVVLYACDGTDRDRTEHRWRAVVDQLEVVDVPGTHTSERFYLRGERVGQLAEDLRRRLEGLDNSS